MLRLLCLVDTRELHHDVFGEELGLVLLWHLFLELSELFSSHLALLTIVQSSATPSAAIVARLVNLSIRSAFLLTCREKRVRVLTIEPKTQEMRSVGCC